jgi:hypothetical protein
VRAQYLGGRWLRLLSQEKHPSILVMQFPSKGVNAVSTDPDKATKVSGKKVIKISVVSFCAKHGTPTRQQQHVQSLR